MKAQKFALLTLIVLLLLTGVVYAQNDATDASASGSTDPDQAQADKDAAVQLSKEERKKAAKQKKRTMESCLTLVRSFYSGQDAEI